MILSILKDKPTKLFIFFTAFFVANALIAECIGGKLFSLESLLHIAPANFSMFGEKGLNFTLTCGVLLWPLEFVLTDIVNEYYGPKAVRRISFTAVALISYAFLMFYLAIHLPQIPRDKFRHHLRTSHQRPQAALDDLLFTQSVLHALAVCFRSGWKMFDCREDAVQFVDVRLVGS